MKLFAGNGCPLLARRIANKLTVPLADMELTKFQDDEINVEIKEHVRGEDTFIIQSTCRPANDNLMELAATADALRRSDAHRVVAVIPYYGYSRQDRRPDMKRTPITARLVADLLQAAGVNYVVTVDIHSDQQQGFFNIPFVSVSAATVLNDHIKENCGTTIFVVSPDFGGVKRARSVAKAVTGDEYQLAIVDKRRPKANVSEIMNIIGGEHLDGRNVVMVDDIVDTAGTLCKAGDAIKERGAQHVYAYVTHPVLSGKAVHNIRRSGIDTLVVSDTIPLRGAAAELEEEGRLTVSSVSSLLASTIQRINENKSISEMYDLDRSSLVGDL